MLGINYVLRLMRHWHKLLEEDVGAPPLEDLKARLDGASDNLAHSKCLKLTIFRVPSNLRCLEIL